MYVFSQRTFQEICKGVHMQKNQEQQSKKSPTSMYQYPPPSVHPHLSSESVLLCVTQICVWRLALHGIERDYNCAALLKAFFFSAELLQKSPVVRPKDSVYPVNLRGSAEEQHAAVQEELAFKDQTVYSYQQISCLDSVIRYKDTKSRHGENWWCMDGDCLDSLSQI